MDNAGTHDAPMIGGGQAGIPPAPGLAAGGMRSALAGREGSGGSCVNLVRIPTKAVVVSARVARQARRTAVHVHPAIAEYFRGMVS